MRRLCECGAVDSGEFCSKCGKRLAERPILGPVDEMALGLKTIAEAVPRYFKTLMESCRPTSSVYICDSEGLLGPIAFLSTSLVLQGWALHVGWPADPLSSFELPPGWRGAVNVIDKLPLSLPAFTIVMLCASSVVPWLLLRLGKRRVPFQRILRLFCYLQGGPGTVLLLAVLFLVFYIGYGIVHVPVVWLRVAMLLGGLWVSGFASFALSGVTGRGRWLCLGLVFAGSLFVDQTVDRLLQSAFRSFHINSSAMSPTLRANDFVLSNKLIPSSRPLRRHEVVAFMVPEDSEGIHIARIVGMPGEVVAIRNKKVLINGGPLDEEVFVSHTDVSPTWFGEDVLSRRDNMPPLRIPGRAYFIMGDNRDNSWDSRFYGPVPEANILGLVYFRILPMSRAGLIFTGDHGAP